MDVQGAQPPRFDTGHAAAAPRLLLIAPRHSYRIAAYLRAADELGTKVLVASDGRHSVIGALAEGLHIDTEDPAASMVRLREAVSRDPVQGVIGTDDGTIELASQVAEYLGLPGNPPQAARYARRKDLARARLHAAGAPVPDHHTLRLSAVARGARPELGYPLVLKPVSLSASRGVIRVDDEAGFIAACQRIRAIAADLADPEERDLVLVERYLPGREVALEGLLDGGRLEVLALFDKPDALEGPYFEETYYVTPSRLEERLQQRVAACVASACSAYGLREGPVHAELRIDGEEVWILEVAARTIGGQCARLLELGTGRSLEQLVVAQATGRPLARDALDGAVGVLMIPIPRPGVLRRVEGVGAAMKVPFIEDVEISVREGYELVPLPEGSSYLGFIFARAPTAEQAEAALRAAHARLNVVTAPVWKLGGLPAPAS